MLIPEQTMLMIDVTTLDVTDSRESGAKPKLHTNGAELHEQSMEQRYENLNLTDI